MLDDLLARIYLHFHGWVGMGFIICAFWGTGRKMLNLRVKGKSCVNFGLLEFVKSLPE